MGVEVGVSVGVGVGEGVNVAMGGGTVGIRVAGGVDAAVAVAGGSGATFHPPQEARTTIPAGRMMLQMRRRVTRLLIDPIIAIKGRIVKRVVGLTNSPLYVRV